MSKREFNNVVEQPSKASDNLPQLQETMQYNIQRNTHNNFTYWIAKRNTVLQNIATNNWCNYR